MIFFEGTLNSSYLERVVIKLIPAVVAVLGVPLPQKLGPPLGGYEGVPHPCTVLHHAKRDVIVCPIKRWFLYKFIVKENSNLVRGLAYDFIYI